MSRSIIALALILVFAAAAAPQEEPQTAPRVRAKEPTVVTVEGAADRVAEDSTRKRSIPAKIGNGIREGAIGAARAVVLFGGWLLNVDDNIPSPREAERQKSGRSREGEETP